jgi:cyclophilin family peptidyl-prolyl cis-trans isomerase
MTLQGDKGYRAIVRTARGAITIELLASVAPVTANNFVFLAREGYYEGSSFHRVVPGFIAQGGDRTGSGRGDPGYRIPDELSDKTFEAGTVGMANAGPNSNGAQFFVVLEDAPHLNGRFSAFGRVTEGLELLRSLEGRDPDHDREPGERIESIEIVEF